MDKNDTPRIEVNDIAEAIGLLTRLPVNSDGARGINAAWAWPLAGLCVALLAWVGASISLWLGLGAQVAAGLAIAIAAIATGAMHEDGLADCADGFWGGYDPNRRLEIMKDSHIGTYGVLALILVTLIRWQLLALLFAAGSVCAPLIAAAVLSRAPMAALMARMEPARPGGLSAKVGTPEPENVAIGILVALILSLLFVGFAAIPAAVIVTCAALGIATLAHAKIGGQTGDVLGATQILCEVAALASLVAILT